MQRSPDNWIVNNVQTYDRTMQYCTLNETDSTTKLYTKHTTLHGNHANQTDRVSRSSFRQPTRQSTASPSVLLTRARAPRECELVLSFALRARFFCFVLSALCDVRNARPSRCICNEFQREHQPDIEWNTPTQWMEWPGISITRRSDCRP